MASIDRYERGGRKGWRARWRDPEGNQRTQVFDRKVDAEQHLTSVEHRKLLGDYIDPNAGRVTFQAYAEEWRVRQVHRPSTRHQVETYLRRHAYPVMGDRELRAIRKSDVQAWVTGRSEVLAPGSVELVYRYVASIFADAVEDRLIARSPCSGIRLPRKAKVEVVPPTLEQVEAIADRINQRYRVAVILAAGAGLRLGEVFGLTVDRIDFMRRTVSVDRQLVTPSVKGAGVYLGPPKTPSSVRTVPLSDEVVAEVAMHLERFPTVSGEWPTEVDGEVTAGALLITSESDVAVRRSTIQSAWRLALRDAEVDGVRFHDLRHFYASALISAGCSVKVVQKNLGHSSAVETLDTYSHMWPDDDDRSRAAISAAFSSSCVTDVSRGVTEGL